MILMIDNYDSFTYNLVHSIARLGEEVRVERNDAVCLEDIRRMKPTAIFVSPGPCSPREAGISVEAIRHFSGMLPILGVCLGHQAIGYAFGGEVVRAKRIMHGKTSPIFHDGRTIYRSLPNPFEATRYHSLIVDRETLPECLEISAWTEQGEIMGLRHPEYQAEGVQFHPESILTVSGDLLITNFIRSLRTRRIDSQKNRPAKGGTKP
jgi:anthranilate synthase/aminodeoxychorismate synthase-like glutamine amidotransferase